MQCRVDDQPTRTLLEGIHHKESAYVVTQERDLLHTLEGGCKLPLAVKSMVLDGEYTLVAMLWANGQEITHSESG